MKYILHTKKALSKESCTDIISSFESSSDKHFNERGYDCIYRDLYSLSLVRDVVLKGLTEYKSKHPFLLVKIPEWNLEERFLIQKFSPTKYYGWSDPKGFTPEEAEHCEHGPHEHDSLRILVWMIYLNDIKRKGGTRWPQQNFTSKPRAGDMYIWPAGWTHSHHGIPASHENKYLMSGWCSLIK